MTEWLLILTFSFGGQTSTMPVGRMISEQTCAIAGAGMIGVLESANPGLTVRADCVSGVAA